MRDLKLDPTTGDLDLTGGGASIISGEPARLQRLRCRLRMFAGEWFLDTRRGVPYYQRVLVASPDLAVVAATMQAAIIKTEGVVRIRSYSQRFATTTRKLYVTCQVEMTDGELLTLQEVPLP